MNIFEFINSLSETIITFGYIGIFIAIFLESGAIIGAFLPGDSLLFTLGLLSAQTVFNLWIIIPSAVLGAVLGDSVGYAIGKTLGPSVFKKEESLFFKKEYLARTQDFFIAHGKSAIIIARFVPIMRTFTPIMAGVGKMNYSTFLIYNIIGGIIWVGSYTLIGYTLGALIPGIEKYLFIIITGIVIVSFIPFMHEIVRWFKKKK